MLGPHLGVWTLSVLGLLAMAERSAGAAPPHPPRIVVEVGTPDDEYTVKAAYLYNFVGYTTWPKGTFEKDDSPIKLLVVGKDRFGKRLEEAFKDKRIGKRPVTIERAKTIPKECDANVVFCSELSDKEQKRALAELTKLPLLLIGETPGFAEAGATINLYIEGANVRFEINTDATKRSGLTLSSQLLKLAKIVKTKKREEEL